MTATDPPTLPLPVIESYALRAICGQFVTGVTVITSGTGETASGTTVNSFTSVSLAPPLVLFCLHRNSRLREVLGRSRMFVVNFLASRQQRIAWAFAKAGSAKLVDEAHHRSQDGMPILSEALAFLVCRVVNEIDAGDHVIYLGEVIEADAPRRDHDPLVFFRGVMGALQNSVHVHDSIIDG